MRAISILFILFVSIGCEADRSITVQEAHEYLGNADILFLDVRTRQEFVNEGRIKNALLIPVSVLERRLSKIDQHKKKRLSFTAEVAGGLRLQRIY